MLTRKQLDLLKLIQVRVQKDGVPPSFDEMKEALNLKSKSGIHRLITALEERGFIRRLAHRARAIEIIKFPDGMDPSPAISENVIEHDFRARPEPQLAAVPDFPAGTVPLLGQIAAGTPIEAIQHTVDHISVPHGMLSGRAEHYALTVKGDSMIEKGIFEGDTVVIQRQDTANDGDIVVALVDDQEATLKTLRRKGGMVELHAANPFYEPQRHDPRRVKIQGRMVGLIRTY